MIELKLNLNRHNEGDSLDCFKGGRDYLVYWEGSWFVCVAQWNRERRYLMSDDGMAFHKEDDFLWTELPMEVSENA